MFGSHLGSSFHCLRGFLLGSLSIPRSSRCGFLWFEKGRKDSLPSHAVLHGAGIFSYIETPSKFQFCLKKYILAPWFTYGLAAAIFDPQAHWTTAWRNRELFGNLIGGSRDNGRRRMIIWMPSQVPRCLERCSWDGGMTGKMIYLEME